ncbi:MAG: RrF2 family transcriptional regulator [Candidatus Neoclostridium sp.]
MMISTRGRYALRVMLYLAEHGNGENVPMKEVAKTEDLSLKYLEQILPVLTKNGLIEGVHGKGGGYRLTRKPEQYTVEEILRYTEGTLAPVACMEGSTTCERAAKCKTLPMWSELDEVIGAYLSGITLYDLMTGDKWKK